MSCYFSRYKCSTYMDALLYWEFGLKDYSQSNTYLINKSMTVRPMLWCYHWIGEEMIFGSQERSMERLKSCLLQSLYIAKITTQWSPKVEPNPLNVESASMEDVYFSIPRPNSNQGNIFLQQGCSSRKIICGCNITKYYFSCHGHSRCAQDNHNHFLSFISGKPSLLNHSLSHVDERHLCIFQNIPSHTIFLMRLNTWDYEVHLWK